MVEFTSINFDPFAAPSLLRTVPSTESQRELWTASQFGDEASLAFNEAFVLTLRGALDHAAFNRAFDMVVASHEALHACLSGDGTSLLIEEPGSWLAFEDLSSSSQVGQDARLQELRRLQVSEPIDLARAPLFRARLVKLADDRHEFLFVAHHIVCDGWSTAVILADLADTYTKLVKNEPTAAPTRPLFSAYAQAEWARAAAGGNRDDERYWLTKFQQDVPALDLPLDAARPPLKTYTSRRIDFGIDLELTASLKSLGAKHRSSLFATLLAGFAILMHRLAAAEDVVIGIPAAGQSQCGESSLVGHCVNMLPFRTQLQSDATFLEYLKRVQTDLLDAYEHQNFTFGTLLRKLVLARDPSRLPLMSVSFNVDQAISKDALAFEGLDVSYGSTPRNYENFELFVNAVRSGNTIVFEVQYNTDLFAAATIERWFRSYDILLRGIVENPLCPLNALPLLTTAEQHQRDDWNASTRREYPRDIPLGELLLERAMKMGEKTALIARDGALTYRTLSIRAAALAKLLKDRGIGPGKLVGISLERSSRLLVAVLGVLRSGAAYVPLDPSFPRERLAFMVEDSALSMIVTEGALSDEIAGENVPRWHFNEADLNETNAAACPAEECQSEDAAYVIFTSGSTGKPKGVVVPRRGVANFLDSMMGVPGMTTDDRLLAVTTLSFDISVLELLLPIWVGGTIVLATSNQASDGIALNNLLLEHQITVMQATPATWRLLLPVAGSALKGLKVLCGGEALSKSLADELLKAGVELWNMYGPTETTVWSTCHRILPGSSKISIGKPIANTQIHILDADLRPTPLGVVGELCIAGDGVTLGYLNRSDLTKLAFIDNPFGSGKLYRTGDLARFSADGTIECLGRKDGQVKLRGYRIELGEIESVLGRHPSVKHCVTIVREDRVGDQRLVAYVVATGAFPDSEVFRTFLRQAVPDYMVPQHFVEMAAFPLTPNGKVDKKRLPAPVAVQSDDGTFEAPTTESEMIVQKVWQKVLGLPRVSANDDFFKLGGHSLLAAQVVAQVSRETGLEVSMRRVFDASLLKNFAKVLDEAKTKQSQSHSSIPIRANQDSARLSPMQQRVWFMEEMNPGTSLYNLGGAFRMHGKLNRDALERALNEIARRHSTMRTTIDWKDEKLLQLVAPELKFELIPVDLSTLPPADREAAFHEALVRDVHTPFDISKGPLVRSHLYHLGEGENALTFCAHHAIWDGWSFDILLDELDRLYTAFTTNERPTLPAIETTYGDYAEWFAEWMNGPELTSQLEFWKGQFAGEVPVLELPTDFPRPASKSFDGSGQSFRLSADLTERLSEVGQRHGVTFFMVLLAGFEILLHRLTSQGNIVIGTPMRSRSRPELEPLIGYFVNPLPLHFRLSGEMRIADLLEHTKQVCVNAFEHQDLPFDVLVNELALERDTSRTPLYSTFFTFQDARNRRASFGDLSYDVVGVETPICPTDLNLWTKRLEDGTVGALEYATDLFTAETAKRWVDEYVGILECIAQAYQHSVGAFPLRAVSQQNSVLAPTPVESDRLNRATLVDLFEEQVERTPASPAVSHGQVRLTYAELNERANRVANCLINRGISRGSLVGICLERSTDLLVATLAVQKCGAAYVPLDPSFPAERLRLMVEDSGLEWIILHDKTLDDAPLIGNVKAFDLSGNAEAIDAASTAPQARETGDTASLPAYVIYTSGSTGKPKGVVVSQRSLVNFVWSMKHTPGMAATDKLLAVTTLSFDIAVLELYVPLIVGAQVIIASRETALDGDLLDEAIDDNGITVMQATPSTWRLLIAAGFKGRHPFKILCGGEAFPLELAQKLLPLASEVWNMYGPTETTVWSTCQKLIAPLESIHIGKPIANTSVYVTGSSRELVPLGSVGELWIGGDGVAIGYHHRPDLTTERFIANPFGAGRVYKTGDLVRLRSGGELEYLRRNDNQVKIRGFRIELGEIETALARHPGLSQVVVMVREDEPGDTRLVAYLVASDSSSPEDSELRSYLKKSLPDYMVPQVFVRLPALPVTPNGKVDRKALPKPGIADVVTHGEFMAPRSNEEVLVANTWKEVLRISQVGLKDNFFDIGGHSLLCLQMTNQLEKLTGVRLNPRVILRNNLEQVAEILRNEMTTPTVQPSIQPAAEKPSLARRLYGRITGH